jgi:hypothetical protein
MKTKFHPLAMDELPAGFSQVDLRWTWYGYLAPVHVTLLTSPWKAGKTTLLTGLLQCLGDGRPFLGRDVRPAKALVISEEANEHWAARVRTMPLGPHVELLSRPFTGKPSADEWNDLIDFAWQKVCAGSLDVVVIDPLATFLPGRCENDAASLLEALMRLHKLTAAGAAVLLLHHPRKGKHESGHGARGSGALLGFVDVALELTKFSPMRTDHRRRRLVGLSRRAETPPTLSYQWNPETGRFEVIDDPVEDRYRQNWETVLTLLKFRKHAATATDLIPDWPADGEAPTPKLLNEWLLRAYVQKKIRRDGRGVKADPFRYRLENEDDEYRDRGELPPMKVGRW